MILYYVPLYLIIIFLIHSNLKKNNNLIHIYIINKILYN